MSSKTPSKSSPSASSPAGSVKTTPAYASGTTVKAKGIGSINVTPVVKKKEDNPIEIVDDDFNDDEEDIICLD